MIQKKICLLGAFAAGKTSLVRRFLHSIFSDQYITTVGVKVDKKEIDIEGQPVNLLLWDLAGEDEFQKVRPSYLRGSAGFFLVIDGTRRNTMDEAISLRERAQDAVGAVPVVIALNKTDLAHQWEIDDESIEALRETGDLVVPTSAKTGEGVDEAFHWLAQQLMTDA